MKKEIFVVSFFLLVFLCYGERIETTYDEVKNSIQIIEKYVREGKEDILSVFIEAIEIEKRATTLHYAEKIREKICKTANIKKDKFNELRKNFSFFDISIAWALSQIKGIPMEKILKEKQIKNWEDILIVEKDILKEKVIDKIKELNPRLESF